MLPLLSRREALSLLLVQIWYNVRVKGMLEKKDMAGNHFEARGREELA